MPELRPVNDQTVVYTGERLRAVAMPLGGIGTGSVALCGDGSLRQWQLNNTVNHLGYVPHSFFAVRARRKGGPAVARVLQCDALYNEEFAAVPCANDVALPDECKKLLEMLPGVQATEFVGEYPVAEVRYLDDSLPVDVSLRAYSPFCPLDAEASGIPAIVFQFTVHNPGDRPADVKLAAVQQNFVGWDGVQHIRGVECPLYGGNFNNVVRLRDMTGIVMENTELPAAHPKNGSLCLAALQTPGDALIDAFADIGDLLAFWQDGIADNAFLPSASSLPSPKGRTKDAALTCSFTVPAGESHTVTFLLCWHFPNRYVDYVQWFSGIEDPKSLFWIGNAYATRFGGALAVAEYVRDHFEPLDTVTTQFRHAFFESTLPAEILDVVSSQMSIIRTPTCFVDEKGRFFGFEGCNGVSTSHHTASTGGCCPLNCSHVFSYEMSLAALFPDLERTMRETELFVQLHPTGYLPHRVTLPLYMPRPWDRKIGGPEKPALDGLLTMVLKTCREARRCRDVGWLERAWPRIETAMSHLMNDHDSDGDGVLKGEQPNTYDISVYGPNTFVGTLYLAALRAAEQMALLVNKPELAQSYRARFDKGRAGYDELLWNGEYWIQKYDAEKFPEQNYGEGCHSDQLFGQWWAHILGLGYLLPEDHVKKAVESIVRYNFRENFAGHLQKPRQFASDDESGVLVCSWPHGGRPPVPTLYSDEVWTGIEYEAAALCLYEDQVESALAILRAVRGRYNGARRSPWNDIECGDHYIRAMSSWALLDAACGYQYDASSRSLTIVPRLRPDNFRAFFLTASGWGQVGILSTETAMEVRLVVVWGEVEIQHLAVPCPNARGAAVRVEETELECAWLPTESLAGIRFEAPLLLSPGQELVITMACDSGGTDRIVEETGKAL